MSSSERSTVGASRKPRDARRLFRVFVMSGLGAMVLGAAFWPPQAVQRRLAVRLTFADDLTEGERQAKLAEVEAAVVDPVEQSHWAADSDVQSKPKPFVFARIASFLPMAVRAESTLQASPIEEGEKLTGVEVTFADSDGLRAERFAHAIVRSFDDSADASPATFEASLTARDPAHRAEREEALASIRREQDQLRKALEEHFRELRSLRSELSDESSPERKGAGAEKSTAGSAAQPGDGEVSLSPARPAAFAASTVKNVLWQVAPSLSQADIQRRIEALDADIAAKKAAREELLAKFTAHHPVASALGVAIERLERERRDLQELRERSGGPASVSPAPVVSPQSVPHPTAPRPAVAPPAAARPAAMPQAKSATEVPRPAVSPAPAAAPEKAVVQPSVTRTPEAAAFPAAEVGDENESAVEVAAAEIAAHKQEVAAALERAIRSEETLQEELRSLAEASKSLTHPPSSSVADAQHGETGGAASMPPALRAEIADLDESESVENRFALLVAGSALFACLMTGLTWLVSRERAVGSADEVRRASGLPVVGQSTAGLLDRKPKRDLASFVVSGSSKLVEGAAFATAVFCVAALAAENPRCEQILRQPLAIAWQALQSLT